MKCILLTISMLAYTLSGYTQTYKAALTKVYKVDSATLSRTDNRTRIDISQPVSPDHYTATFGFFCKQELKLEKMNVPLHFRVGDPKYCNYLESKNSFGYIDR